MPVREKMQPQPPAGWRNRPAHPNVFIPYSGSIQMTAYSPPAHMPTAQPVCEEDGWYWVADEGGTE